MNNIAYKLTAMASIKNADVYIHKFSYSEWMCRAEGNNDGLGYKIESKGDTVEEAVDAAFTKFLRITGAVPEITGALPPPALPDDSIEGDHFITPSQVDDDIPF